MYLDLAKKMIAYGWILVAVTAASPLLDSSFVEKGVYDRDVFTGMASVRCSEMGYWNHFTPILRYESAAAYADSIRKYVEEGFLTSPSELYYPVRLKPRGENRLDTLRKNGVDSARLTAVGRGGSQPVVARSDKDNWWKNRRVEFILNK